jgi:hypothetical protein
LVVEEVLEADCTKCSYRNAIDESYLGAILLGAEELLGRLPVVS